MGCCLIDRQHEGGRGNAAVAVVGRDSHLLRARRLACRWIGPAPRPVSVGPVLHDGPDRGLQSDGVGGAAVPQVPVFLAVAPSGTSTCELFEATVVGEVRLVRMTPLLNWPPLYSIW